MAKFALADYETVDERIQRFYRDNANGRIETQLLDHDGEHGKTRWIVRAEVYKADSERASGVGHAFELDGQGMANKTSALENAETSAVGRALAQAGYSGSRRTTREEMAKVLIQRCGSSWRRPPRRTRPARCGMRRRRTGCWTR